MDRAARAPAPATVWEELREFRVGGPLSRLVELVAGLPSVRGVREAPPAVAAAAAEAAAAAAGPKAAGEGSQIFGLFASRYFLFGAFAGFVISRIHALVHRQRVRALGPAVRGALYGPALVLVVRAMAALVRGLDAARAQWRVRLWLQPAIQGAARRWAAGACADADAAAGAALWQGFVAWCVFDCVDVFVARLEGSPCVPYEYIGGLIERTSLYYFYGMSARIHELALIALAEKLMLGATLVALPSGWRWRLVPTGIANALMMHHFFFAARNHTGPRSTYPIVQTLSMLLLAAAAVIVLTTVAIHWLARAVDRLSAAPPADPRRAAVALYDRSGVFQGTLDEPGDDARRLDAAPDALAAIVPDLRRDFGVEILDLAGTCLQQCSSQLRSTGLGRPCGAIRLPKTTALDEYIAGSAAGPPAEPPSGGGAGAGAGGGLGVFVEDEPTIAPAPPSGAARLASAMRGTRANSVRRLSLGLWAVAAALSHYALDKKARGLGRTNTNTTAAAAAARAGTAKRPCASAAGDPCSSDESDYDYVCAASDESDGPSDTDTDADADGDSLVGETAWLLGDALEGAGGDRLAAAVAFMARLLLDREGSGGVMTRSMCARQLASPLGVGQLLGPAPFAHAETETLAQLIQARRQIAAAPADDSRALCVVCWASARCVMLRPCRCLCLCNDCRVALAVRSFDHCPCCRRPVAGYSRVYAV
ncbi:hypothetical protein H4R18_003107 [Coemansia javaensis]|uniref:RING-type domain-containing protein n=1 Tax=Coemansia javaensis TaxID=2761396 RepID=A0A9W8HD50_9FUNG|nr:hypothetical protein H4R18_003107 [Coemansia javaensis]